MAWRVERGSARPSILVGAAHFFPRRFRRQLKRSIEPARVVLLEGPLDAQATQKVLAAGRGAGGAPLYRRARERINAHLGVFVAPLDMNQLARNLVFGREDEWLEQELAGLKPWAAFFGIWTRFRAREGWEHKMDLDAAAICATLGKRVQYLESIEEQIAALEAVPVERYARFLASGDWRRYNADYERHYRAGDLEGLARAARDFPTYCEPVIGRRDRVLAERARPELEAGGACVVIGVAHCPGVLARLAEWGFRISR
jgi:hypothetical protein